MSPFQKLYNQLPDYNFPKVFGYSCFPLLRLYHQHKLDFYTQKCLFIGYSPLHNGYKCLDKSGKVIIARHVIFNESEFPYSELFSKEHISIVSHTTNLTLSPAHFSLSQELPVATCAPTMSATSSSQSSQQTPST